MQPPGGTKHSPAGQVSSSTQAAAVSVQMPALAAANAWQAPLGRPLLHACRTFST